MGLDLYSVAVIGIRIPQTKLYPMVEGRGCPHQGQEQNKFCSECGNPVYTKSRQPIPGFDPDADSFKGFKFFRDTNSDHYYLGIGVETGSHRNDVHSTKMDFNDLKARIRLLKEELQEALQPQGLWDEKELGFWVFSYASY